MTPVELLAYLRAQGLHLTPVGDRIRVTPPKTMTPEQRAAPGRP